MQKMSKKRLDEFRNKLTLEISCLEEELKEIEGKDTGGVILKFDWNGYYQKKNLLEQKKLEQREVKAWIEAIEDGQTRWVFKMWYIEKLSWKKIAKKMGIMQSEDYPRKCIRDAYLIKIGIE